jgi:hypothetical protein
MGQALGLDGNRLVARALKDIGGNCDSKDFSVKALSPDPSRGVSQTFRVFEARDGGSCQYEGSNGQFLVTLYQHNGKTAQVKLNVTQYDGPRSGYKATCYEKRGINCTGDNFGKATGNGGAGGAGASVNLYFWPTDFTGADIGPAGYTYCTDGGSACDIPQTGQAISVAYGANGKFTYKNLAANHGSFNCGVAFFGNDPIFGTIKGCFYKYK